MTLWALIGIAVGVMLGMTGAGGAVLAVPLFVHLADATIHQATVFSLIAVLTGAALSWALQWRHTDWLSAIGLATFSSVAVSLCSGFKADSPDWLIKALYLSVCIASLFSLWLPSRAFPKVASRDERPAHLGGRLIQLLLAGLFLGSMVTMTGLGGGVILIPLLSGPLRIPMSRAVATSLLTVLLTATISAKAQWQSATALITAPLLLSLVAGSLFAAILTRQTLKRFSPERLNPWRRWMVSAVIAFSMLGLLF